MDIIEEAFEYTRGMPQNSLEAFRVFCALNVISVGAKKKLVDNHRANGILRPHVARVVTYALEHPELNILDAIYFDTRTKPNCVFIICMGIQFSYHNIPMDNDIIVSFCNSEKNKLIAFDGIKKQPIAEEMFEFAKDILANNITDRTLIKKRVDFLSRTYAVRR
jgi:hypothetical protein